MRPLFCLLFCAASFAAETVTLRADVYPPYNTVPGDKPGVMIEVAQAVFAKSGITVDYKPMPWSRSLKLVEAGEVDGAVGADPSMGETYALSTTPQAWWEAHLFTAPGQTWTYQGLASLASKRLGVVQEYSYGKSDAGEDIDAYIAAGKGVEAMKGDKPIEILLGMLQRDRVDVLIESPAVIKASLAGMKLPFEAVRDAGTYSKGYGLHIAFTKNDRGRRLAKMLGDGTVELRTSGELKKILERYEMTDWVGR